MKKFLSIISALLIGFSSNAFAEVKNINLEKSTINWFAAKVLGKHHGTIKFKTGSLNIENGKLVGGSFDVDMNTIDNIDQTGENKANLVGHLKSADFFEVEKFPIATLKITEIKPISGNKYNAKADLTIKGITNPIEFVIDFENNKGSTKVVIDRSKFNVRFGSESFFGKLGDKAVYDNFELAIEVGL